MNKKFSKEELLKSADSGLTDLSCEQIKKLIQKESQKNYEDINTDFIDLCFDVLEMKQNDKSLKMSNIKIRSKKNSVKKTLIVAAVFMAFIVTTLTVSAMVFNFNIPKEISLLVNGSAKNDINLKNADTTADNYLLVDTQLSKKLNEQGINQITFPEEMINENCKIIKVDDITTDETISIDLSIEFEYKDAFGRMNISQYSQNFEWTGEMVDNDVISAEMIKVNGMDILLLECKNSCIIRYKDRKTIYDIYLETDLKSAKLFAESIK